MEQKPKKRTRLAGILICLAICVTGLTFLLTRSKPEPARTPDFTPLPEEGGETAGEALSGGEGPGAANPDTVVVDEDRVNVLLENREEEQPKADAGWTHYLLLGVDELKEGYSHRRSDAMLVLSVSDEKERVVLSSVPRDTLVYIEGKGFEKLTNAYAYGGASLTVQTFADNFDIEVENYITINFEAMMELVDLIGGVEIELTEKEASHMEEMYGLWGQESGRQTLDGWEALCYCRIRRIDSDYKRNDRQFRVLMQIYEKVRDMPASQYTEILNVMYEDIYTDMTVAEALVLAGRLLEITKTATIENVKLVDGDHSTPGSLRGGDVILVDSLSETARRWREALEITDYAPGRRLEQISEQLEALR